MSNQSQNLHKTQGKQKKILEKSKEGRIKADLCKTTSNMAEETTGAHLGARTAARGGSGASHPQARPTLACGWTNGRQWRAEKAVLDKGGTKGGGRKATKWGEKRGRAFFFKFRPNSGRKGTLRMPLRPPDPRTSRGLDARALPRRLCVR